MSVKAQLTAATARPVVRGYAVTAAVAFACLVLALTYPAGAVLLAVGWVGGWYHGRTRAERGRLAHEIDRDIRNTDSYRKD